MAGITPMAMIASFSKGYHWS